MTSAPCFCENVGVISSMWALVGRYTSMEVGMQQSFVRAFIRSRVSRMHACVCVHSRMSACIHGCMDA